LAGIGLVPPPIKELDDEIAGKVLRVDLAPLFLPQPYQGGLVIAHYYPGVRAADELAPFMVF
jgi:hypothetical protein